jgi:hypothetical protein
LYSHNYIKFDKFSYPEQNEIRLDLHRLFQTPPELKLEQAFEGVDDVEWLTM